MRLLKVGCRASWCWMLCTSIVGCLSEMFISVFKSKHSNAMQNIKLCLHFLFHPNGIFVLLLFYMALCTHSCWAGAAIIPLPSAHSTIQWCTIQQAALPGALSFCPEGKLCFCCCCAELFQWKNQNRQQFICYVSGFCKDKRGKATCLGNEMWYFSTDDKPQKAVLWMCVVRLGMG